MSPANSPDTALADLLSRCAHDLRAALAAVQGYAGLLASGQPGPLTERQKVFLNGICAQQDVLHKRLEAFIVLAKYLTGARSASSRRLDLAAELHAYALDRRNPDAVSLPEDADPTSFLVLADVDLLSDVLDLVVPVCVAGGGVWRDWITLSCFNCGHRVWITINDTGRSNRPGPDDMVLQAVGRLLAIQNGAIEWAADLPSDPTADAGLICRLGFPVSP